MGGLNSIKKLDRNSGHNSGPKFWFQILKFPRSFPGPVTGLQSFMLLFKKYLEIPDYLKTQKCIQKEAKSEILNVNMVKLTAIYTGSRNSDRILILDFITISNRNF